MSGAADALTIPEIQQALSDAGLEIYQTGAEALHIAERVRLHLMDSGVRVATEDGLGIWFTARAQRSDAPSAASDELFERVRSEVGRSASDRGYRETEAEVVEVKDPVDDSRVLDVWHEITYLKRVHAIDEVVDEVRWALDLDKYIRP